MVDFLTEKDINILENSAVSEYADELLVKVFFNFAEIPETVKLKLVKDGFNSDFKEKVSRSFSNLDLKQILKLGYFLGNVNEYFLLFYPVVSVLKEKFFDSIFNSDFKDSILQGLFNNILNFVTLMRLNLSENKECVECLRIMNIFAKTCNYIK